MDEGQVVVLDHDGTNLVGGTTVDTLTGLDDHRAHSLLLKLLEVDGDLALPLDLLFLGELGNDSLFHRVDLGHTGELVGIAQSSGHLVVVSKDAVVHLGNGLVERILLLDDGAVDALILLDKLKLSIAESTEGFLAKLHGGQHVLLGNLLGSGLDHGDEVAGAAELKIKIGILALLIGGIDQELAGLAIAANAHAGKRTLEGHTAERKGQRGAHHADNVAGVGLIGHKRGRDNLDLVAETIGEARAQRAVDHAGGKRSLLARTTLALEVAARNAAGSVHLLVEIDGEREEVVVLALLGHHRRKQHGSVALLDEGSASRLLGELARFEGVRLAIQLKRLRYQCHYFSFISVSHVAHGTIMSNPYGSTA